MKDLRCESGIKFGEHGLADRLVIEVKCRSSRCGARSGAVVIHRFDALTGDLLGTQRLTEPPEGGTQDYAERNCSAVRTP